jgi:tripartite ATP-independent transporter DctM subunit
MIELSYGTMALVLFAAIIFFIGTGMPIAVSFMTIGVLSFTFLLPEPMLHQLGPSIWAMLDSGPMTSVVSFILMGELMMRGELSKDLYNCMEKWLNRLPGGLAQVNLTACSIFAAISGSSVTTAATIGVIAGPEMEKRGYDNRLTYGSLAAGGTLGILIPPSIPLILYGALTSTSVGKLFMAGVLPGIVATLLFMIVTTVWSLRNPKIAPSVAEHFSWMERFKALAGFLPTAIMIIAVLGGIYGGIVTPTEAAAFGAAVASVILIGKRKLTLTVVKKSLLSTIVISSMSYMLLAGSSLINFMFTFWSIPTLLAEAVVSLGLSPLNVLIVVCLMYLVLGMFIDGISMVILTVPTVVPLMTGLGFDVIWVAIILVLMVEIALVTPPVGVNLYVLQGIAETATFMDIVIGVIPYIGVLVMMVVILYLFPGLALWLPGTM